MFVATLAASILLAIALVTSALNKLNKTPSIVEPMNKVGVPTTSLPALAALELSGAAGLLVGLYWWPMGVAAAIGVVLYFVGAAFVHLRARDTAGVAPAAVLGVLAIAALSLRLLSS